MYRKGNAHLLLVGLQIDAAALKNSMEVLKKKKIELSLDLAILLLGIYLKEKKKKLIPKNIFFLPTRTYCIAYGTLLNIMWQTGWEGSVKGNEYVHMYDQVPSR